MAGLGLEIYFVVSIDTNALLSTKRDEGVLEALKLT